MELRPGLWRWTTPHPEWQPADGEGTPASWPRDVGCVFYEIAGHGVFIDPLAPADDGAFWGWADERCAGREIVVLETIAFHRRNRDAFTARYDALATPPAAVVAYPLAAAEETVFWLPEHRALVPGDSLIGAGGGLSLCPASWLEDLRASPSLAALRDALRPLLELDVELVLVSHGEPACAGGHAALAAALAA